MSDSELLLEFNFAKNSGDKYISPANPEEFMFLSAILESLNDIRRDDFSILRLFASQNFLGLDPQSLKDKFRDHSLQRVRSIAMIGILREPSDRNDYTSALMPILAIWGANERQQDLYFGLFNNDKVTLA